MKKTVFVNPTFYHKIKDKKYKSPLNTFYRNSVLLPLCIGSTILVHNGKEFLKVFVSENIIGHKLGEFSASRRRYFFKKGKMKQQNKK